jgi:hypothetical protein
VAVEVVLELLILLLRPEVVALVVAEMPLLQAELILLPMLQARQTQVAEVVLLVHSYQVETVVQEAQVWLF